MDLLNVPSHKVREQRQTVICFKKKNFENDVGKSHVLLFLNNIKTHLSLCLINIEHPSFVYQSSSTFKIGSPWNILKATCVVLFCTQIFRKVSQLGKLKCQVRYYVVYHKKVRILWATESMNKCEDLIVNGCELQCITSRDLGNIFF